MGGMRFLGGLAILFSVAIAIGGVSSIGDAARLLEGPASPASDDYANVRAGIWVAGYQLVVGGVLLTLLSDIRLAFRLYATCLVALAAWCGITYASFMLGSVSVVAAGRALLALGATMLLAPLAAPIAFIVGAVLDRSVGDDQVDTVARSTESTPAPVWPTGRRRHGKTRGWSPPGVNTMDVRRYCASCEAWVDSGWLALAGAPDWCDRCGTPFPPLTGGDRWRTRPR